MDVVAPAFAADELDDDGELEDEDAVAAELDDELVLELELDDFESPHAARTSAAHITTVGKTFEGFT